MDAGDATVFAQSAFCRVWSETFGLRWEPLPGAADLGVIFAQSRRLGLRNYTLAPRGLYWGASGVAPERTAPFIEGVADRCRGVKTVGLTWSFRHDMRPQLEQAASALGESRCKIDEFQTHVLPIEGKTIDEILTAHVKGVTRRHAVHAREHGVEVRPVATEAERQRHDAIYRAWAQSRGVEPHPAVLFTRLATELGPKAQLLGAFEEGALIAAILLFCDREEWFYWHGVRDPERDRHFAMDALFAHAVDAACRAGARSFNMGASNGIRSLETFKERWGAQARPVWSLTWAGRVWPRLLAGWRRIDTARAEVQHAE